MTQQGTRIAPSQWILSPRQDLCWFHGSVLAGLALLLAFCLWPLDSAQRSGAPFIDDRGYGPAHPAVLLLLAWGVCFDGTHVFGTYARSYLAGDATSRAGLPGPLSFGLVLLGPVLALIDWALLPQGPSQLGSAGLLFRGYLMFAYLWAYWHLVRQHYGFLVLYHRRQPQAPLWSKRLDIGLLWAGSLYPFARFSTTDGFLRSGLPQLLPLHWLLPLRNGLDLGFGLLCLAALALLIVRRGQVRPGPRHLLLAIVVAFEIAVFALLDNLLTITATLTIFHNLQYHRIVWQYERGLGREPAGGLVRYLLLGGVLGVAWYGPRVMGVALVQQDLWRNVLLGLGWGVALHHYLVDGRIWRVRRTPGVAQALDAGRGAS